MLRVLFLLFALVAVNACAAEADVQLILQGKPATPGDYAPAGVAGLTLRNGLISITFGSDGSATSLIKNGQELVHNLNGIVPRDPDRKRTWYIDYSGGGGRLVADVIRIVRSTPEIAHIAIIDNGVNTRFYLEHHILLMKGESGLFGYVICKNLKNQRLGGEMRTMYRLDRDIFDWAYVSERTGQQEETRVAAGVDHGDVGAGEHHELGEWPARADEGRGLGHVAANGDGPDG